MSIISRLTPRITPKNYFLFLFEDKIVASVHGLNIFGNPRPGKFKEYPLDVSSPLNFRLQQIVKDFKPKREDSCYLGLSLSYFSIINFSLPAAARENLEQAVEYALMRHIPHDLSDVFYYFHFHESGGQLFISAIVCLKEHIQDLLETVASAGITLFGIFPSLALWAFLREEDGTFLSIDSGETQVLTWVEGLAAFHAFEKTSSQEEAAQFLSQTRIMLDNAPYKDPGRYFVLETADKDLSGLTRTLSGQSEDLINIAPLPLGPAVKKFKTFPYLISLVPDAILRRRKTALRIQVGALVFLLLTVCSFPVVQVLGQKSRLNTLQSRIAEVKIEAEELQALRRENEAIQSFIEEVSTFVNEQPKMLEISKELTEIISENTWLQRLTFSKGWIQIHGTSDSATSVIEALEKSPLFSQASFDSPVSKKGNREVFKIVVKVNI